MFDGIRSKIDAGRQRFSGSKSRNTTNDKMKNETVKSRDPPIVKSTAGMARSSKGSKQNVDRNPPLDEPSLDSETSSATEMNHLTNSGHVNDPTSRNNKSVKKNSKELNQDDEQNLSNGAAAVDSPQTHQRPLLEQKDTKQKLSTLKSLDYKSTNVEDRHALCRFHSDKRWLEPQFDEKNGRITKPDELQDHMTEPTGPIDDEVLDRIQGSMIGMALGDALGAHVEFRPQSYLAAYPVKDLVGGGTWGLKKGQFTDDTSMALCLANSLVARRGFCAYDQLVRYKWWYKVGYMSSTGECFDIGNATRQSIDEFDRRQIKAAKKHNILSDDIDYLNDPEILDKFKINCSEDGVAGNGALMRLAPVPLFFFRFPLEAIEYSGISGKITHGDTKAYDACRYYGALIVCALHKYSKKQLLDNQFYTEHKDLFGDTPLCDEIRLISKGSYKKKRGYKDGIRGKGYIVNALEAALWAFWSDENSFEKGALAAVNLGDDTDTTAAIYGQLAGAYYGYKNLPEKWLKEVYAKDFMLNLSKWIAYEGENWQPVRNASSTDQVTSSNTSSHKSPTKEFDQVAGPSYDKYAATASKSDVSNQGSLRRKRGEPKEHPASQETNLTPTESKTRKDNRCADHPYGHQSQANDPGNNNSFL